LALLHCAPPWPATFYLSRNRSISSRIILATASWRFCVMRLSSAATLMPPSTSPSLLINVTPTPVTWLTAWLPITA